MPAAIESSYRPLHWQLTTDNFFKMPPDNPLAALRDIHTAPTPHWWPPAPGWWLLAAGLIALLLWGLLALVRRRRRLAPWRCARDELDVLHASYRDSGDGTAFLRGVSVLLRRAALTAAPQEQVAALHGQQWLDYLDRSGDTDQFSSGSGRVLADGPYAPQAEVDADALYELTLQWLKRQ